MGKVSTLWIIPWWPHKLTIMRDKNTSVKDFRELVSEIGMLITYEATRDLPMTTKHIETPICEMRRSHPGRPASSPVVPILRAGLGLVDGVLRMVPAARVGHIGMYRDEETLEPHPYFCKMPKDIAERDVLIVDPMLATGGSAAEAIGEMKKRGCKHIKLMVLVAAPEGIKFLQEKHPDVDIYCRCSGRSPEREGLHRPRSGRCRRPDLRHQVNLFFSRSRQSQAGADGSRFFPFFICSIQLSVSRPQIFLAFFPAVLYNRVTST